MIITGERIDIHAHIAVTPPPFAERYGDPRWPSLQIDGAVGRLYREGNVVRTLSAAAWSLEARLEDLDATRLDCQVVSPVPPMICETGAAGLDAEWARHLNRGIAAAVAQCPTRFAGLGTVPLGHPEQAVETMKACPGLSVCLSHGGGTFAWALPRIAHMWDARHDVTAAELVRNIYVDTVVFDAPNIRYLVDRLGADHVLFGTDHPMPGCDSLRGAALDQLGPAERQLIERDNICSLLSRD